MQSLATRVSACCSLLTKHVRHLALQVMMERMVLSGFVHPALADCVVGAICGAGVLAACAGAYLPLLGYGLAGEPLSQHESSH